MKSQFCYIAFHPFLTVHLTKESGKIPEIIGRMPGWQSRIVRFNNETLENHQAVPHSVEIISLKRRIVWKIDLNLVWYLFRHASHINVLLLYHFDINTIFYGILYKLINRHGFLWNKLDLHEEGISEISKNIKDRKFVSHIIFQKLVHIFLQIVDLISTESHGNLQLFQLQFPEVADKLVYLPTGIDIATLPNIENIAREKIILTVARLGAWQKGTDLLLEGYALSNVWPDWKLVLVGSIEKDFLAWVEKYRQNYPEPYKSIIWVDHLDSRIELARWYKKASIFCFPSRFESFGLALLEAGYYGCACISSDFAAALDILDRGNCGLIFPSGNIAELTHKIEDLCHDQEKIQLLRDRVQESVLKYFNYETIISIWYEEYRTRQKLKISQL